MDIVEKISIEHRKNYRRALKFRKERALEKTIKLVFMVQA